MSFWTTGPKPEVATTYCWSASGAGHGGGGGGSLLHGAVVGNLHLRLERIGSLSTVDADGSNQAESHEETGEPPGSLLNEVGRLAGTQHLGGSREVGGKATTFGILDKHNQCEQNADDDNQDYDDVIQHIFL